MSCVLLILLLLLLLQCLLFLVLCFIVVISISVIYVIAVVQILAILLCHIDTYLTVTNRQCQCIVRKNVKAPRFGYIVRISIYIWNIFIVMFRSLWIYVISSTCGGGPKYRKIVLMPISVSSDAVS